MNYLIRVVKFLMIRLGQTKFVQSDTMYKFAAVLGIIFMLLSGCSQGIPAEGDSDLSEQAGELAKSADRFVDSIGINTHYYYLPFTFSNGGSMVSRLEELGVRYVRDGIDFNSPNFFTDPTTKPLLNRLLNKGIRFAFITDFHAHSAEQVRDWFKQFGPKNIASVENRNESDLFDRKPDGSWPVQAVRDYQIGLWRAINNDPATRHIEVIGPSFTSTEAAVLFGSSVANYMDRANIHNYLDTREPETLGWGDDGYGSLDYAVRRVAQPMKPNHKAPLSTETCYQNITDRNGLPEKFSGRYIPRQYLFSFANGIPRTYCYELWDEGDDKSAGGANFGFLRFDGSPKPAFTAVKNMIALLRDPGGSFQLNRLAYRLSGNTDGVQRVLLQKRNGDFYLALWLGKPSWEPNALTEIIVPRQAVTLTLPAQITQATSYALNDAGNMIKTPLTIRSNQVRLSLSDRVMFLELVPAR